MEGQRGDLLDPRRLVSEVNLPKSPSPQDPTLSLHDKCADLHVKAWEEQIVRLRERIDRDLGEVNRLTYCIAQCKADSARKMSLPTN